MDILAALESTGRPSTGYRCKVGRFLDDIPDDQAGKAELAAILETPDRNHPDWRPEHQIDALLIRLGHPTSLKTIGEHRAGRCRCSS